MWKKLLGLARDVFDIRRQVKGHDKRLDGYSLSQENLTLRVNQIADRVLRLELELHHTKEQHARELAHCRNNRRRNVRFSTYNWKPSSCGFSRGFLHQAGLSRCSKTLPPS